MEKLQFLDFSDLTPGEEEQLNEYLYNGDSSEVVELPPEYPPAWLPYPADLPALVEIPAACCAAAWIPAAYPGVVLEPDPMSVATAEEHLGEMEQPVDYASGNPMMAPHTMQYSQMMPTPSVYVSNVTANVNVHSFMPPQAMPYPTVPFIPHGGIENRKTRPSKTPTKRSPDMRRGIETPPANFTPGTPFTPPYFSPGPAYPYWFQYPISPHCMQQPIRPFVATVPPVYTQNPNFPPQVYSPTQVMAQPVTAVAEPLEESHDPVPYHELDEKTELPASAVSYEPQSSEEEPQAQVDTIIVENTTLKTAVEENKDEEEEEIQVVVSSEEPKIKVEKPPIHKAPPANAFKSTPALAQKPPFPTGPAKQRLIDDGPEFIDPPLDLGPPKKSYASLFGSGDRASNMNHLESPTTKPLAMIHPTVHNVNNKSTFSDKPAEHKPYANSANTQAEKMSFQDYDINLQRLGEFLTQYQLDHKPLLLQPRGLTNRSNYCYVNAILQALVACPPFYNLMKAIPAGQESKSGKSRTPIIDSMVKFVNEFSPMSLSTRPVGRKEKTAASKDKEGEVVAGPAFEPAYVYKMLSAMHAAFPVEGRQEDAEEFLSCLLNGLNDEMLEAMKLIEPQTNGLTNGDVTTNGVVTTNGNGDHEPEQDHEWTEVVNKSNKSVVTRRTEFGRTPLSAIFRGQMRSRVTRSGVENGTTDNIQPFFTLQLDIEKASSVEKALELLVGKDAVEGGTCPKTNQEVCVYTQTALEELPLILLLHLKCFDYKLHTCSKITKVIEFPIDLKIDAKLLTTKSKISTRDRMYKLLAVVYHDGKEATKGHYITDVYHMGYAGWVRYDDASVRPISSQQVLNPRSPRVPYLLYYRRSDTINPQDRSR